MKHLDIKTTLKLLLNLKPTPDNDNEGNSPASFFISPRLFSPWFSFSYVQTSLGFLHANLDIKEFILSWIRNKFKITLKAQSMIMKICMYCIWINLSSIND